MSTDQINWPLQIGIALTSFAIVIAFDMKPPTAWLVGWLSALAYLAIERRINRG